MAKLAFAQRAWEEVARHAPADLLSREWMPAWTAQWHALVQAGGLADAVGIACARLELLGALHAGETGEVKSQHFQQFCERFLVPVHARWRDVHNLSGASHSVSEFHASFRTRVLWGAAPPPHTLANPDQGVVGFSVGSDEAHRVNHMRVLQQTLYLHVPICIAEVVQGIAAYAAVLREDKEPLAGAPGKPTERFRRGLWWRLRPSGLSTKVWAAEGAARGVPGA